MQDAELEKLHALMESVGEEEQPEEDVSAAEWLRSKVCHPSEPWNGSSIGLE